jgi:tRNA dimethylallyltransferase
LTKKPLVIALVGPTCTGKTALSIELAKNLNGEIIACDSRTVYQYMDIGTAKPTIQERCGIPHHLLDVVTPGEVYTAANYKEQATSALEQIIAQGKIPIVCGGTGLYARALLEGFSMPAVEPNVALREELNQLAQKDGIEALHKILEVLDPVSKGRIQANDRFRIIRAIEVSKALGRPFSEVATRVEVPYDVLWLGLNFSDRNLLKERIILRLDEQLKQGVLDEIEVILKMFGKTQALVNAVPYKEYLQFIDGQITLEEATQEAIKHNFELARRQVMWFRANKQMHWMDANTLSKNDIYDLSMKEISSKLALQK